MDIDLRDIFIRADRSTRKLRELMKECGYDRNYEELENVEYDPQDPDAAQTCTELTRFFRLIDQAAEILEYLKMPVKYVGQLWKNKNDRYELQGKELTCGSPVEILIENESADPDQEHHYTEWFCTRIEYNQQEQRYYAVGRPGMCLEGVIARKRG